jgi:U6 snRNA-associated Sm-like protein LSm7
MSRRHYEVFIRARVEYFTTDALADDEGNESSRNLGLIVARGTLLVLVSPVDGSEEIENPFQAASED